MALATFPDVNKSTYLRYSGLITKEKESCQRHELSIRLVRDASSNFCKLSTVGERRKDTYCRNQGKKETERRKYDICDNQITACLKSAKSGEEWKFTSSRWLLWTQVYQILCMVSKILTDKEHIQQQEAVAVGVELRVSIGQNSSVRCQPAGKG